MIEARQVVSRLWRTVAISGILTLVMGCSTPPSSDVIVHYEQTPPPIAVAPTPTRSPARRPTRLPVQPTHAVVTSMQVTQSIPPDQTGKGAVTPEVPTRPVPSPTPAKANNPATDGAAPLATTIIVSASDPGLAGPLPAATPSADSASSPPVTSSQLATPLLATVAANSATPNGPTPPTPTFLPGAVGASALQTGIDPTPTISATPIPGAVPEAQGLFVTSDTRDAKDYYAVADLGWHRIHADHRVWFLTVADLLRAYPSRVPHEARSPTETPTPTSVGY